MAAVTILLDSRRVDRASRIQSAATGFGGLTLAIEAQPRLAAGGGAALLGAGELALAAALIVHTVRSLRGKAHAGRWVDLLAGLVMLVDGLSRIWGPSHRPSWALVCNALAVLVMAALAPRMEARRAARRALRLDGDQLVYRRNRWRGFALGRSEIERVEEHPGELRFVLRGDAAKKTAERRIPLADLRNRDAVVAAVRAWAPQLMVVAAADPSAPAVQATHSA